NNDEITEIQYDWFNRPVSVRSPNGSEIQTAYDQNSRMVYQKIEESVFSFLYSESSEIGLFQDGKLVRWNLLGDGVVGYWVPGRIDSKTGKTTRSKKYYYLPDQQGSIRRVISDRGELVSADEYYPFGSSLPGLSYRNSSAQFLPGYSGKQADVGLGWLHFGRRQYNPALSRWFVPDPKAGDYLAFSPYAFTANNPIGNVEKDGAYFDTILDLISLGYSLKDLAGDPADYKNWTAVALDVIGIAAPGAAGLGLAYKTAGKAGDIQSAINKAETTIKGICSGKKAVFRGDRRMPTEIFETGFAPRGESLDLLKHSRNNMKPPSNYVSTSTSPNIATKFAQEGNYVYVIRPQKGVDVNKTLGSKSPYPYEKEIAIPDGVKPEDIIGARKVGKDGKFTGEFIKNPNYKE
ncbi:MAG: RHS repeat-associated core domain-containing protein, partial [Calditrichota bacterium]